MLRVIVSAFLLLPCVASSETTAPIRVGAIYALTGDYASWGQNCRQATQLALDEVRHRSGAPQLEFILEDSPGAKASNAVTAFRKLTDLDKVKFILGPMSPEEFAAVAPLADRAGVPVMPFGNSKVSIPAALFVWMDPETIAQRIADYVAKRHKKVAVLSSNQEWETQVDDAFRKRLIQHGVEVPFFEQPPIDSTDIRPLVARVKSANVDAVFITSYQLFPQYVKALQALQIRVPRYSIELDAAAISAAGEAAEGLTFIRPAAATEVFSKRFKDRWESEPDVPASQCYDALMILVRAIEAGVKDKDSFVRHIKNFPPYSGASGEIRLDGKKTIMNTEIYKVIDSKMVRLER